MEALRKSIHPEAGATWQSLAATYLSELDTDQAVSQLQSWNLHIFARRIAPRDGQPANPILPSDIVFLEPPLA